MTFEIVIKCSVSLLSSFSIFLFIFTYGPDFFLVFYTNMWQMFFSNILLRKKKKKVAPVINTVEETPLLTSWLRCV